MAKVALIVNFTVKPQHLADFLTVIRAHAAGTLADEPGCVRFDVLTAADASPTVILVEAYADQAAYDHYNQHPDHQNFVQNVWLQEVVEFLEADFVEMESGSPSSTREN